MSNVITIPASRKNDFEKLAKNFQGKQAKYNLPIGSYTYAREYVNYDGFNVIEIGLENFAEIIRKDDADEYSFCGVITRENGIVKAYVENDAYAPYFKEFPQICDHCGTNRFRTSYFIFEKGENQVNIGSTCVKDYFGINAVEALAFREKLLRLRYAYQPQDKRVLKFAQVAAFVKDHLSDKWEDIKFNTDIESLFDKGYRYDTTADIDDCRKHYEGQKSGFEINCYNALKFDFTPIKNWRMYFCAVYFYMKKKITPQVTANKSLTSNYKIGDRISASVKVLFTRDYFKCYDFRTETRSRFVKMIDTVTNEILTTYSSKDLANVCVGDAFTVTGTVKEITNYRGTPEWSITRCKKA